MIIRPTASVYVHGISRWRQWWRCLFQISVWSPKNKVICHDWQLRPVCMGIYEQPVVTTSCQTREKQYIFKYAFVLCHHMFTVTICSLFKTPHNISPHQNLCFSQGINTPSMDVERKETPRCSTEATATPARSQNPSTECVIFRTVRSLSK